MVDMGDNTKIPNMALRHVLQIITEVLLDADWAENDSFDFDDDGTDFI